MRPPVVAIVAVAAAFLGSLTFTVEGQTSAVNAPTGFDNRTNGFLDQVEFDDARAEFEEREEIADGLGPVFNAQVRAAIASDGLAGRTSMPACCRFPGMRT